MSASKREVWKNALAKVAAEAAKAFPDNPGKVAQLQSHLITAAMVVDDLHDTVPFVPPVL